MRPAATRKASVAARGHSYISSPLDRLDVRADRGCSSAAAGADQLTVGLVATGHASGLFMPACIYRAVRRCARLVRPFFQRSPDMTDLNLSTDETRVSYGIGRQLGDQLRENPPPGISLDAVIAGIRDAFGGAASQVSPQDLNASFAVIRERMQAEAQRKAEAAAGEGKAFLAENAKRDGVTTLESGLQYEILTAGEGAKPTAEDQVRTHYHGTLIDGTVFDSSYQRGQPAEFPVGGVIAGWTEALQLMGVGSKWRLYVPSELAYGAQGVGSIPPHSVLVFDVELLAVL